MSPDPQLGTCGNWRLSHGLKPHAWNNFCIGWRPVGVPEPAIVPHCASTATDHDLDHRVIAQLAADLAEVTRQRDEAMLLLARASEVIDLGRNGGPPCRYDVQSFLAAHSGQEQTGDES